MNKTILLIDDEPDILELLVITITRMGFDTSTAENYETAINLLNNNKYDCCLTDMRLPDGDGLEIVKHIQTLEYELPVAIISAHGNMELAINALKAGAFDFVSKPISLDLLRNLVSKAIKSSQQFKSNNHNATDKTYKIIGDSPAIKKLNNTITKVAKTQVPVYIQGDSGTGKELVAHQIHQQSARSNGPFVAVNCGAIPSELMESEFFGHKKGSFTGANDDRMGLFQSAEGGTLFLDEIADLPFHMQVKLLRVLQEKKIRPIGNNQESLIDVRIISASHKNLSKLVTENLFRQDLFYRINVIQILVPSLAERKNDIALLVSHFLNKIEKQNGYKTEISQAAIKSLQNYPFPGNIRELENILERSCALCEDNMIKDNDLNLSKDDKLDSNLILETEESEKNSIRDALNNNHWNQSAASRELGISLRQLRYRIQKYSIK